MRAIAIACLLGLVASTKLSLDKPEKTPPYTPAQSVEDGAELGFYERVIPARFKEDTDDIFMRSMIKKYAVEERTDTEILEDGTKIGGDPTGKFWMT